MADFYGQIVLQADEKNRYRIPTKYRAKFGDKDTSALFYLRNGKDYLSIITKDKALEIVQKLKPFITMNDTAASMKARAIISSINEIKEDAQGRFTLPPELKNTLNLDKEIVFVGVGDKIELWSKSVWDETCRRVNESESSGDLAETLGELTF